MKQYCFPGDLVAPVSGIAAAAGSAGEAGLRYRSLIG
jgi:hypothetical protein